MKRPLLLFLRGVWYLGATVLVLCATAVTLGQYYFPYLGEHQDELLAVVVGKLPFGVEIDGLAAQWTGLAPTLYARSLRLYAPEDPQLTILSAGRTELRIDLLRSLLSLGPRLRRIAADDVQLAFVEDADGRWRIAGAAGAGRVSNPDAIIDAFLAIEEIALQRTRLVLRPRDGAGIETEGAELALENYRRFRRLHLLTRDARDGGAIELLLESHGDPRERQDFSATAYLRLDQARLARLQPLLPPTLEVPAATLSGELWARWSQDGVLGVNAVLQAPELDLTPLHALHALPEPLRELDLRFGAEWRAGSATVWLEQLRGTWFGQSLELERLRLDTGKDGSQRRVRAGVEYLDIGSLVAMLQGSQLLDARWQEVLTDLAPYGGVANAQLDLVLPVDGPADFRFRAAMNDVSVSPWHNAPGVRNLRGYLEITRAGGLAEVDSGAVTLEFPRLYRHDFDFDRIAGRVRWEYGTEGVHVGSTLLDASIGGSQLAALFDLGLRTDPEADDYLSLSFGLRDAAASAYRDYLPYIVSPQLQEWLDASIEAGHVAGAAFTYHAVFPHPEHPFRHALQLALDVQDAAVSYHPDWPAVRAATGRVLVDEDRVCVELDAGRVLQSTLGSTRVEVLPRRSDGRLRVAAALKGGLEDGLRVLGNAPLAKATGGALRDWKGSGGMALDLQIDMPFADGLTAPDARLDLTATVDAARLYLAEPGLQLESLHGDLGFDLQRGLRSEGIDAMLWGRPVRARIGSADGSGRRIAVHVAGTTDVTRVAAWLKWDLGGLVTGIAPFTLEVQQQDAYGFGFLLRSPLRNVSSTLPAPLAKAPTEESPFELRWSTVADGADLELRLGEHIRGVLHRDRSGRLGGGIALDAEPLSGWPELLVSGHAAEADLAAWIAAVRAIADANDGRGNVGGTDLQLRAMALDTATLFGARLDDVRLSSRHDDGDQVFEFSADAVAGALRIPARRDDPLALELERLQLRAFIGGAGIESAPGEESPRPASRLPIGDAGAWMRLRETQVPSTVVHVRQARFGERELGEWQLRVSSEVDALAVTDVRATVPGGQVGGRGGRDGGSARLRWIAGKPRTELLLGMSSEHIDRFVANWGYENVLEARSGHADVNFRWPGNPVDFAMQRVGGTLEFTWRDGRLLRGSSNNPLMRALGVLNFNEVLRRIRLDFKDLYQSGLAFDTFAGAIDFDQGAAQVRDAVTLDGPSARLRLTGGANLGTDQIDGDLVVTLPIGSNLPWMAALAGGLPAAAGAYVASRIFESQLGKFSSAIYKVSGRLEDPQIEFQKVFDTEDAAHGEAPGPRQSTAVPEGATPDVPARAPPAGAKQ